MREGITLRHLRHLVYKHKLPAFRVGGLLRVRLSEYLNWLEGRRR